MAQIRNRPDLIAERYSGLSVGPQFFYSFETQEGIPVDGTNPLLRELSPFTIRIVPPSIVASGLKQDVNLIGRAGQSVEANAAAAGAVRSLYGIQAVSGNDQARLDSLRRIVSAGQIMSTATTLTERAVLADVRTAADIALQVEQILKTSPLTLLVNPNEMSTTHTSVQNYSERGRQGLIYERWGEAQKTISFSGSTGAFIAAAPSGSGTGAYTESSSSVSGLQFASKRDSAAYQNFMSLYLFYRNNGYIYDTINRSQAHLMIGAIAIDYDQWTYVGNIDSFNYSYQEGTPHRIEWSMEFTASEIYDLASTPVAVQPLRSPTPNPSWPARSSQNFYARPSSNTGVGAGSDEPLVGKTPLDLLAPFPFR